MRITHNILISNFLRNLNAISNRIERSQQQLATGVKFSHPSDGPVEVAQIIGFNSSISKIAQFLKNVDDGSSQVGSIDTTLQGVINDIGRAQDLSLDGANDNLNQADRNTIAQEIGLIIDSTLSNANSRFRDRYMFAGWRTREVPFEGLYNERTKLLEDVLYKGNRGRIGRLVGDADNVQVNINGKDLYMEYTYTQVGDALPTDIPLGFSGILTINGVDIEIEPEFNLVDIQRLLENNAHRTHVFASIENSRLVLESAYAVRGFSLTDNKNNRLIEDLGLDIRGAMNLSSAPPSFAIVDSTPAIFTGAGPVANLTYDNSNNVLNIFLGADANNGVSLAQNIVITPGSYATVGDLINEIQARIDAAFGENKIMVSDAGGGVLRLETVATGDEIDAGDLVIGGPHDGINDTASDQDDLNLIGVAGNAPPTPAQVDGTDGNDKIIIDLGPTASKNGLDALPQVVDLRAGMIGSLDDLLDEIKYQIFQNDVLRGAVNVEYYEGRLKFETVKTGDGVLASDFVITEGATGTMAALNLTNISFPAYYDGVPLGFPLAVIPGFNDTITIDLGPSATYDGTNPAPVTLNVPTGIYNNIGQIFAMLNDWITSDPVLDPALQLSIAGPPGSEYLHIETKLSGGDIRDTDFAITGPFAGTIGWNVANVVPGSGPVDGRGVEIQPSNIFNTLIQMRKDLFGVVGDDTKLIDAINNDRVLLGINEGDTITVTYDAGTFSFKLLDNDTFESFARTLEEIFNGRAKIRLTTDGRIEIENLETFQIQNVTITAVSPAGEDRDKFNEIMGEIPTTVAGLSKAVTGALYDSQRYLRLGEEDLVLIDGDTENFLKHESIIGARANRLTTITNLFTAQDLNVKELKTTIEAQNYPEVITALSQQELVLQSALGVGAKVLTPSLLEFLL